MSQRVNVDQLLADTAKSGLGFDALRPAQLKAMVPMRALRGRPKSENKKLLVSVRYSAEVIEYFKSTGEGWQSRMDGVLMNYVVRHARKT